MQTDPETLSASFRLDYMHEIDPCSSNWGVTLLVVKTWVIFQNREKLTQDFTFWRGVDSSNAVCLIHMKTVDFKKYNIETFFFFHPVWQQCHKVLMISKKKKKSQKPWSICTQTTEISLYMYKCIYLPYSIAYFISGPLYNNVVLMPVVVACWLTRWLFNEH